MTMKPYLITSNSFFLEYLYTSHLQFPLLFSWTSFSNIFFDCNIPDKFVKAEPDLFFLRNLFADSQFQGIPQKAMDLGER